MATYDPLTGLPKTTGRSGPTLPYDEFGLDWNKPFQPYVGYAPSGGGGSTGGGGNTGGGFGFAMPDYQSLLSNDPFYLQLKADLAAQGVGDASQRKLLRNRAIGQFGILPDFNSLDKSLLGGDLQSDLDPALSGIVDSGNQAGTTTHARLQLAHEDAVRGIKNALASRGLLRSGETGYQLGREAQQYDVANYDAQQKLVDYLAGVQAAYTASQRSAADQQRQGAMSAYDRALMLAQYGIGGGAGGPSNGKSGVGSSGGGSSVAYNPNSAAPSGYGGNWQDADGNLHVGDSVPADWVQIGYKTIGGTPWPVYGPSGAGSPAPAPVSAPAAPATSSPSLPARFTPIRSKSGIG